MPIPSARRAVTSALAAAALAACGSTVQQSTSNVGLSPGLDGAAANQGATGATSSAGLPGGASVGSPGSAGGTSGLGTSTAASGAGSATATGSLGASPLAAPKAGKPLLIGIPYVDQQQSSAFTAGIGSGLETGDPKANFQLLVDILNSQGGILGHKVVIVFHRVDPTESQIKYEQETCADFTEDRKVPFVLGGVSPTLAKCLIGRGVGVLGEGGQVNTGDYEKMRYWVQPGSISLDRLAALQASEFTKMGLFKGAIPAKVGVLYYDVPAYRNAEKVLVDGLRQRGVNVLVEEAFHQPGSTQDVGQTEAQVQSAVLKFKTAGITHVVGVELNAWLQGFFALYSSQQDYYPRYGWTSNQVPTNAQAVVPHKELERSLVLGFYPTYDTERQTDYPKETARCLHELTSHGAKITSGNQRADAVVACDGVHYLKAALTAGNGLTRDALVAGARALGHSYVPASTYASFLPKGYGGGIAAMRPGAWSTACDCFAYTGKPYLVS